MDRQKISPLIAMGVIIAGSNIIPGISLISDGAPQNQWVPTLSWGILGLFFVASVIASFWVDQETYLGLRLDSIGLIIGSGSWLFGGLVLLLTGYGNLSVWGFTIIGALVMGITFYSEYARP